MIIVFDKKNICFNVSIILYAFQYILSISNIEFQAKEMVGQCFLYGSILFCLFHIALNTHIEIRLKLYFTFLAIISIGLINYHIIGFSYYLVFFLYIVAAKFCSIESAYKTLVISMAVFFSLNALLAVLHLIPMGEKQVGRYGLGLNNYVIGFYAYHVSLVVLYLFRNKLKNDKTIYFALLLLNIAMFLVTKTRLTLLISLLTIVMSYLFENVIRSKKIIRLFTFIFPILFLLDLFMVKNYRKLPVINSLLTGRLGFQSRALDICGTSLFPRAIHYGEIKLASGSIMTFYIDSGFMDIYVKLGLLMLIGTLLFYTYLLYLSIKQNKTIITVWLISVAVFNIINTSFFNIMLDSSLLLVWDLIKDEKNTRYLFVTKFGRLKALY